MARVVAVRTTAPGPRRVLIVSPFSDFAGAFSLIRRRIFGGFTGLGGVLLPALLDKPGEFRLTVVGFADLADVLGRGPVGSGDRHGGPDTADEQGGARDEQHRADDQYRRRLQGP